MWPAQNLTPPWMILPSDQSDPTYAYRKALYDFCRRGQLTDYDRLDAILYSEYGDRPIGELPKLYGFTTAGLEALAIHVFHQFNESWMRLLEDYVSQYKPLENYSMTESGTDVDKAIGETVGNTNTKGFNFGLEQTIGDETVSTDAVDAATDDYKVTNTVPAETTQQSVSTYDASEKNTVKTVSSPDGTAPNQTQTTMTEAGQHGSVTAMKSDKGHTHEFQRSGNIGVMTATDMLKNDSEFWSTNDFFSIIASNIASLVTNPYYE